MCGIEDGIYEELQRDIEKHKKLLENEQYRKYLDNLNFDDLEQMGLEPAVETNILREYGNSPKEQEEQR